MKMIEITMPDQSVWQVPAKVVAANRAKYYAEAFDRTFEEEFTAAMTEDQELLDWSRGNMNWSDVAEHATKVRDHPPLTEADFQEGWVNGDKEIVERE